MRFYAAEAVDIWPQENRARAKWEGKQREEKKGQLKKLI